MLQGQGGEPLTVPPLTAFEDDNEATGAGGKGSAARSDPDAASIVELPRNLRLWN
jgi:hypothetical protein